jgi:hypothetical protein
VGSGGETFSGVPAALAPAGSRTTRVFWVQLKGDAGCTKLVTSAADVADLAEEVAIKLKLTQRTSSLVLQLASADGTLFTAKDAAGNEQPVTLDSMDTIDEALKKAAGAAGRTIGDKDKLRIIVLLPADAPLAASADGEDADAVQRRSVRSCFVPLCRRTA